MSSSGFRTDRRQQERFTTRIRNVIREYPWGLGVIKEFLANADDAGSEHFVVVFDKRQHTKENLIHEGLKEWQGPAILFFNSEPAFRDADIDSFTRSVGNSAKAGDSSKVGQFGLGAITAYHFTDVVQLLTGSGLLLLDPHALYLPDEREALEAELFDSKSSYFKTAKEEWPGSIVPFEAATLACSGIIPALQLPKSKEGASAGPHSSSSKGFPGTLFRLPLRNEATASKSEVCKTAGSVSAVEGLLRDFAEAVPEMLLFTRHVRKVSVLIIEPGAESATVIGEVTAVQQPLAAPRSGCVASKVTVSGFSGHSGSTTRVNDIWLKAAVSSLGNPLEAAEVAARYSSSGGGSEPTVVDGNLFCCMPLPFSRTGLPVHVHASWALQSNRRELWSNIDDGGQGQHNFNLLERCAAPAWASLLLLMEQEGMPRSTCGPYRLWPPAAEVLRPTPIERITDDVAAHIMAENLPLLVSITPNSTQNGQLPLVAPSDATFLHAGKIIPPAVLALCSRLHTNVVQPPKHILQALDKAANQQAVPLKYLTPQLLRMRLKAKPDSITHSQVAPVLQYVISDAPQSGPWDKQMAAELHHLPLLLVRPRRTGTSASAAHTTPPSIALLQTSNATADHWLCCNSDVAALPELLPDSSVVGIVDTSNGLYVTAIKLCLNILSNVKVPSLANFAAEMPGAWRCDMIKSSTDPGSSVPSAAWQKNLWKQAAKHWQNSIPAELSAYALVPVIGGLASQRHCSSRSLVRRSDVGCLPAAAIQLPLVLQCLAAAGCLCAADSTADQLQLTAASSRRCPAASADRIIQALEAGPRHLLLATLQGNSAQAPALRTILALAASTSSDANGSFLRELPVFEQLSGGLGRASDTLPAPSLQWEVAAAGCDLLDLPLLLMHSADETQRLLLMKAGLAAPNERSWLLSILLPHIAERLKRPGCISARQRPSMRSLQILALKDLGSSASMSYSEIVRLKELQLVMDTAGVVRTADNFVLLDSSSDGLRPLITGSVQGFGQPTLRALPAEYNGVAFVLEAAGLHTAIDGTLFHSIALRCKAGELSRLTSSQQQAFREALGAAVDKQTSWDAQELAGTPVFMDTCGVLIAADTAWVAPTGTWQHLLHTHRAALPQQILQVYDADTAQQQLLSAAGFGMSKIRSLAVSMDATLLLHIARYSNNRSLQPLVLKALQFLDNRSSSGSSLSDLRLVFGSSGPARPVSAFLLLDSSCSTIEGLLPESDVPRLPEQYHPFRRLLSEAGLQTELTPALFCRCITEFMRQHAVGEVGPAVGITLLQRLEACMPAFRRSLPAQELRTFSDFVASQSFIPTMELSRPRSIGAFSPRPALVSLRASECFTHGSLVASQTPLTAVTTAPLRELFGQPAGPNLARVLQHLISFTGPEGIVHQRLQAGEGRREAEEDLQLLYDHTLSTAAAAGAGSAVWSQVVEALCGAAYIRVPHDKAGGGSSNGSGERPHFVQPQQLCFNLEAPRCGCYPVPAITKKLTSMQYRQLLLAQGAMDGDLPETERPSCQPISSEARFTAPCQAALLNALPSLFDRPEWSDLTVMVEGESILVHRIIIAPHSEPLAAMWRGDWKEAAGQVTLEGILSEACSVRYTAAAARAFFGYFYTGKLDLSVLNGDEGRLAMELLVWGAIFAVPEIVAKCEGHLAQFVDHDNVCNLLQIAHHHGAGQLEGYCVECASQWLKLIQGDDFERLPEEVRVKMI